MELVIFWGSLVVSLTVVCVVAPSRNKSVVYTAGSGILRSVANSLDKRPGVEW